VSLVASNLRKDLFTLAAVTHATFNRLQPSFLRTIRRKSMTVAALFASHTPLKDYCSPGPEIEREVDACLAEVRDWVAEFEPDLVIALGPDHFNGFFYRVMPSFCIGTAMTSVGDWNTPAGVVPVAVEAAQACVRALHNDGIDVAISHRMEVDHGFTQLLNQMFEWSQMPPVLPVFVNCAAPPLPPLPRVVALGRALGNFAAAHGGKILITASGGLSHDPPIPTLVDAPEPVRERLIAGGTLSNEARAARQQRVLDDAGKQVHGLSERTPLNPLWDQNFLDLLKDNNLDAIYAMDDNSITVQGGCGGHEIRPWLAAAAAARVAGSATFEQRYYRTIPEWVAGYGIMTAC
jgi:2,3-dihydroxyphenylpropionate 1,2-dioxygenase